MSQKFESSDMPGPLPVTRRRLLLNLAISGPMIGLTVPRVAGAANGEDIFLKVSRVITGNSTLSAGVALRINDLLTVRIDGFASKLNDLSKSFEATGGGREQMLSNLSHGQVKFALALARPWYLGYVGQPSNFVLNDDAVFATYLEAQSWSKIVHEVPRPTYPDAGAGWWEGAPAGVAAPAMPEGITRWNFHPGGPAQILAPDPTWRAYATAHHASVDAARNTKPSRS